jgi:hypothetical protein
MESETISDGAQTKNPSPSRPAVGLQAEFSQMLSGLPIAPEDLPAVSTAEEEDFRTRRKVPQPTPAASETARVESATDEDDFRARRKAPQTPAVTPEKAERKKPVFEDFEDEHEAPANEQSPASRLSDRNRASGSEPEGPLPANIFGLRNDDDVAFRHLRDQETVVDDRPVGAPRRRSNSTKASGFTPPPAPAESGSEASITERILGELEKYSIPAVSQLRIAVHGTSVTIVGEVPGDYEKQLIVHFCKKVPGVGEVVDMMRVVGGGEQPAAAAPATAGKKGPRSFANVPRKAPPKNWKPSGYTLQLPFRAKHVGIAVGLMAMVWAGFTFATRDGSRLSVSPVTGKMLVDGAPAEGASVILHPADPRMEIRPRGAVGPDGTFKLTTYLPGDGAPAGDYRITVEWRKLVETPQGEPMPGPNLLPAEWSKPETTIHKVTVAGTTEIPPIQVTK